MDNIVISVIENNNPVSITAVDNAVNVDDFLFLTDSLGNFLIDSSGNFIVCNNTNNNDDNCIVNVIVNNDNVVINVSESSVENVNITAVNETENIDIFVMENGFYGPNSFSPVLLIPGKF